MGITLTKEFNKNNIVRVDTHMKQVPKRSVYHYPCPEGKGHVYAIDNEGLVGAHHALDIARMKPPYNNAENFIPMNVANQICHQLNDVFQYFGEVPEAVMYISIYSGDACYKLTPIQAIFLDQQGFQNFYLEIIELLKGSDYLMLGEQKVTVTSSQDQNWLEDINLKCMDEEYYLLRYKQAKDKILKTVMGLAPQAFIHPVKEKWIDERTAPKVVLKIDHPYLKKTNGHETVRLTKKAPNILAAENYINTMLGHTDIPTIVNDIVSAAHLTLKPEPFVFAINF